MFRHEKLQVAVVVYNSKCILVPLFKRQKLKKAKKRYPFAKKGEGFNSFLIFFLDPLSPFAALDSCHPHLFREGDLARRAAAARGPLPLLGRLRQGLAAAVLHHGLHLLARAQDEDKERRGKEGICIVSRGAWGIWKRRVCNLGVGAMGKWESKKT